MLRLAGPRVPWLRAILAIVLVIGVILPIALAEQPEAELAAYAQSSTIINSNDYASIQDAINTLRYTGGAVHIPAGEHVVSGKVRVYSNITLFGDGMDQTIIRPAASMDDHLMSDDSSGTHDSNIVIRDLTLAGPGRASSKGACCFGLRLVNLSNSAVINVASDNHSLDGFYLGYYNDKGVNNVRLSGCRATNNGRNGISLTHGSGNVIDNCVVQDNNRAERVAGIDLEPDDGLNVSNNKIVGNRAESQNVGVQLYALHRTGAPVANNAVCTNTARNNSSAGIYDFNGSSNVYVNNSATNNGGGSGSVNMVLDSSAIRSTDSNRYCQLPALPDRPGGNLPTATPTATATPSPTATMTPSPTPTHTPTPLPSLSISDVTRLEGEGGSKSTTFQFRVELSETSKKAVSVRYATANGSATSGSDYSAKSGSVKLKAGATAQTIKITVKNDKVAEPDETFFVNLSSPSNASLADAQGVGVIRNDD